MPAALDPLLATLDETRATGVVIAVRGSVQKRVAVERGTVIFAASGDPRDLIGQALLRAGLITEKDLLEALAESHNAETNPGLPRLAAALTAMRRVTPEQCKTVFESKIRESVLDLFLWDSGAVTFEEGAIPGGVPFPLKLPLDALRTEGARRKARWAQVKRIVPDPDLAFERKGAEWTGGFPGSAGDKRLAQLIERGLTMGQILAELHGQDYAVGVRLATLVQSGIVALAPPKEFVSGEIEVDVDLSLLGGETGAVTEVPRGELTGVGALPDAEPPPPKSDGPDPAILLEIARERFGEGKVDEAHVLLMECIAADPMAAMEGWEILQQVEQALVDRARSHGLRDEVKLGLARAITVHAGKPLTPTESFVMSRFAAGAMTIGSLLAICPFQPHEVLVILDRWVADGTLAKR